MALTRKWLKTMGLTDEQVDSIIEAHTETVEGLKEQAKQYEQDAKRLSSVQKELDDLKAADNGGYEEKYNAEKKAFADYKAGVEKEKADGLKRGALDALLQKAGVRRESFRKQILKGYDLDALEMDGDAIKEADKLEATIKTDYADFLSTDDTKGVPPINPPGGGGAKLSRSEIYKKDEKGRYVLSTKERQRAIEENLDAFRK